ncbi:hypothetical protein KUTeg_019036 [Tegillarca granosa]|uniref:C2H2-type domain-containing protein n=1 Tax=Tegillarca granosa TaxID=220873 RepID=A0ABQ9EGT2_TEGGR|nr:hypothetical protein KUTeg_019036 [Tegillarca granosa]
MENATETYVETIAMDGLVSGNEPQEIIIDGMPLHIPSGNIKTEVLEDGTVQVVVYQEAAVANNQFTESSIQTDVDYGNKRVHHIGIQNTTVPQFNSYSFSEVEVQTDPVPETTPEKIRVLSAGDSARIQELKNVKGLKIVQIKGAKVIQNIMSDNVNPALKGFRAGKEVTFHKCGICGKVYKNKTNWQNHLKLHAKEKVYMCGFCGQIFPKSSFAAHIKYHEEEAEEKKSSTNKKVDNEKQDLLETQDQGAQTENEKGQIMKQRYHQVTLPNQQVATVIDLGNWIDNVAMNAEVSSGKTSVDGMAISTTSSMENISGNLQIQNENPKQPEIPQSQNNEMETEETKTKYIYKCNICGKEYNNKSNCQRHLKLHTHDKTYKCDQCGKTFMHRYELSMHQRKHTGEKPFKCPICTRAFNESGNLRRHMKIHTGDDTPYKCGVCFKGFGDMYRLHVHLKVHSGNITCDTCGKKFGKISDLYRHIRIHTGDKPYKCDMCHKAFCQKVNLQTHYRTHTGKTPYRCEICNFGFSRKQILDNHMRRHEEDEEEDQDAVIVKEEPADTEEDTDLANVNAALEMIGKRGEEQIIEVVENVDVKTGLVEVPSDAQEIETGLSQEEIAQLVAATVQ